MAFYEILLIVIKPIMKMFFITCISFVAFRRKLLSYRIHALLSKVVLYITLPMMLIAELTMSTGLLDKYDRWYWLPLISIAIMCSSGAIGRITAHFFLKKKKLMTICLLMCFFHNAGYFPLVIVEGVFPEYPDLKILVMLSVIGVSPLLWSISPIILSSGNNNGVNLKNMVNPPVVSVLAGLLLLLVNAKGTLEAVSVGAYSLCELIIEPMLFIGNFTVPMILIVLGGSLSKLTVSKPDEPRFVITYISTKLFIVPALGLLIIPHLGLDPMLAIVLIVSTMQPTALAMTVQAREFAEKHIGEVISESLFFVYTVSIISLTLFLTILKGMVLGWRI
ncbi:MAG: AEC family transporter [Planctomycetota bacterium]|jgi:predicted permease